MSAEPPKIVVNGDQSLFFYQNGSFAIQDEKLCLLICYLHQKFQAQFIIVTLQPNIRVIKHYLKKILLEVPFQVIYAPALTDAKERQVDIQFSKHPISQPPHGYSFLFNHTKPPPEGWENHLANLEKRLLKTGNFYLKNTPERESSLSALNFFGKLKQEESNIPHRNSSPLNRKGLHTPPVERSPPRIT